MARTGLAVSIFTILTLSGWAGAQTSPRLSDPANAAYWYQKAFDLYGDPNDIDLKAYARGKTPLTPEIEQVILKQKPVLDCLAKAARSDYCDWDFDPFDNLELPAPYLMSAMKVENLLLAEIRIAQQCNPQEFPFHTIESTLWLSSYKDSKDSLNHMMSLALRSAVYPLIIDAINKSPYLTQNDFLALKTLLANTSKGYCSFIQTLSYKINAAGIILKSPEKFFGQSSPSLSYYGFLANRSDEFYKRNYTYHKKYIMSIQKSLDLPYPEAYQELKRIEDTVSEKLKEFRTRLPILPKGQQLTEDEKSYIDTCDFLYTALFRSTGSNSFNLEMSINTQQNALIAALDLLVEYQKSNTLPDATPADNPKDLFSDKPFLLIKTDGGFILKCQGQDLSRNKTHEYSFKLPKR
jgi:hypothetical protein